MDIHVNQILILDFGSQYTQLIARRVRESGVYCEIHPWDQDEKILQDFKPAGIILSGGPESVNLDNPPIAPEFLFDLSVPILGICYGMQTMAKQLGGKVEASSEREYGYAEVEPSNSFLLDGLSDNDTGLLKVDPLNNFNNNIDINLSNLRANININLTNTTQIAVKFNSLFERYNGPINDAGSIFGMVAQASPVNFPKFYTFDEESNVKFNHTLFGNKGNGGFVNPYAEMVRGYNNRFTSTILSQIQIEQNLNFITEGLKLRALAAIKSYSSNENSRSFTPFYYGIAESETESGVTNSLYQIQEGTEYLDRNDIYNYVNSNYYYEFVTQYDRLFSEKHQVGGLLVFNFSESMNTISGNSALSSLPSRNMGLSGRVTYGYDDRYFAEFKFGYYGSE